MLSLNAGSVRLPRLPRRYARRAVQFTLHTSKKDCVCIPDTPGALFCPRPGARRRGIPTSSARLFKDLPHLHIAQRLAVTLFMCLFGFSHAPGFRRPRLWPGSLQPWRPHRGGRSYPLVPPGQTPRQAVCTADKQPLWTAGYHAHARVRCNAIFPSFVSPFRPAVAFFCIDFQSAYALPTAP